MAMFNPPHPGGLITEYIEDNNIGLRMLAKELGVSASAQSKAASGKASVSPEMTVRLEAGLRMAARLWLSTQATWRGYALRSLSAPERQHRRPAGRESRCWRTGPLRPDAYGHPLQIRFSFRLFPIGFNFLPHQNMFQQQQQQQQQQQHLAPPSAPRQAGSSAPLR